MKQFIHIPKTGGTSVKAMMIGSPEWDYAMHRRKLQDADISNIVFTIRDPLDRFLSAAKHVTAARNRNREDAYGDAETFIDNLKNGRIQHILFKPMTHWLGTLDQFQMNEDLIDAVVETDAIDSYFGADSVQAQHLRNSEDYHIEFDETLSEESLAWFKEAYAEDYALYEYIKTRPYYVGA